MTSPAPEKKYTMAVKAYKNPDFLNSGHARFIRVMCEYEVRLGVEWATMWGLSLPALLHKLHSPSLA